MRLIADDTGEWRRYTLEPPLTGFLATDRIRILSDAVFHVRNNVNLAVRLPSYTVLPPGVYPEPIDPAGVVSQLIVFRKFPMPGVNATIVSVSKDSATNALTFNFSDGTGISYGDIAATIDEVGPLDSDPKTARDLLILRTIRLSPDGTNLENQVGNTIAIDGNANSIVTYGN